MKNAKLPPCPKCGSDDVKSDYDPMLFPEKSDPYFEGLVRKCITCGYAWDSPTLDRMEEQEAEAVAGYMDKMTKFEVGGPLNQCFPEGQRPEFTQVIKSQLDLNVKPQPITPSFDERFPPKTPEAYGKLMGKSVEGKKP